MSRPTNSRSHTPVPQPFWGKTLRGKVEAAAKKAPRFLFTSVTSDEPADAVFGPDAITPEVFLTELMPRSIFHMPLNEVQDHNYAAFQGELPEGYKHSLWTSWETSLRSATAKAVELGNSYDHQDVFVVVLDTQGLFIIHETDFHLLEHPDRISMATTEDAFWAFGVLPASNFTMVPLSTLHQEFPRDQLLDKARIENPGLTLRLTDIFSTQNDCYIKTFHEELIMAKKFSKHFGDQFALPVACMVISVLSRHAEQHINWLDKSYEDANVKRIAMVELRELELPSRGFRNIASLRDKASLLRSPDARRGMSLLRNIVKSRRLKPKGTFMTPAEEVYLLWKMQGIALESDDGHLVFSAPEPLPTNSNSTDDFESDEEVDELPKGCMDDETKRILIEAQRHTPRYLFRGWRYGTNPSGGLARLNTRDRITPRAFLDDESSIRTIYDFTRKELHDTCHVHLSGESFSGSGLYKTEFSSWSSSLDKAARFCNKDKPSAYISVIDSSELPNAIIHVLQLKPILGEVLKFGYKSHEYLAHGVISGPAHKAIPLQAFLNIGAPLLNFLTTSLGIQPVSKWNFSNSPISEQDIADAESVGRMYGRKFGAAIMIAIICLKQRDHNLWRDGTNGVERILEARMSQFDIPAKMYTDESILTDIVYTTGWGEVEQMIRMLRAVVHLRHGRGARTRTRAAV